MVIKWSWISERYRPCQGDDTSVQQIIFREDRGTHDFRLGSHTPVLITPLRETLYYVRLVAHEPQKTYDLLTAPPDPTFVSVGPLPEQSQIFGWGAHCIIISIHSESLRINTNSSILSTSYSMP